MKLAVRWMSFCLLLLSSLAANFAPALAATELDVDYSQRVPMRIAFGQLRWGVVAAKGRVLGPNQKPIWAEYNADGNVVSEIGEAHGDPLENALVMSAYAYRTYVTAFKAVQAQYGQQSQVLSRSEYETITFKGPNDVILSKPALAQQTNAVVVRDPLTVYGAMSLVLHESPLDLNRLGNVSESDQSVLLSAQGWVVKVSAYNIGFRTAFYTPKGSTEHEEYNNYTWGKDTLNNFYLEEDQLWGPVMGVPLTVFGNPEPTCSDQEGRFAAFRTLGCDISTHIEAKIRYHVFNPKGKFPGQYVYIDEWPADYFWVPECMSPPPIYGGGGIAGTFGYQSWLTECAGTVGGLYLMPPLKGIDHFSKSKIQLDIAFVTGSAMLRNPSGVIVNGEQTVYGYAPPLALPLIPGPNRVQDTMADFSNQGLLQTISAEDFDNTDIYIFRTSNDQLIMSREGLAEKERAPMCGNCVDQNQGRINYHMIIRGPGSDRNSITRKMPDLRFENFQAAVNVNPALRGYKADHLRIGEQIKVVLVNRATGYIGTGIGVFGSPAVGIYDTETGEPVTTNAEVQDSSVIQIAVPPIYMMPPNIKITAQRKFTVEAGLTKNKTYENTIGFEGAGLGSDDFVAISSEWYDANGTPLPAELPGFTGRLAKVVGQNQLAAVGGQLANFAIQPGKHLQLVRLPQGEVDNDHYYLHVSGEPPEGNPNFADIGAAPAGPLQYRPAHYVPVQVPLFDEVATTNLKESYRTAVAGGATGLNPPVPVYRWVYRPEMQFSVFDLDQLDYMDEQGQSHDLLKPAGQEVIVPTNLSFAYSLIADGIAPLAPFGPGRVIVLAVGDYELQAYLGPDNTLIFQNIEDLAMLSSDDFLAIRLYQNGDDANVLWEYAFQTLDLDLDSDNNDQAPNNSTDPYPEPSRSMEEEKIENIADNAQNPGKVLWVNNGDIDGDGVPNFADGYDKFQSDGERVAGVAQSDRFVPIILEIPESLRSRVAKIKFSYAASYPDEVSRSGAGTEDSPYIYTPAAGHIRVWKKDGDALRLKDSLNNGGDYIAPGIEYDILHLGSPSAPGVWRFYLEAIQVSQAVADQQILVEIDPDGSGPSGYIAHDLTRATAVNFQLVQPDENNDTTPVLAPYNTPKYSETSPDITIAHLTVTNVRPNEDGSKILGDISLQGAVTSKVCDFTPGNLGIIESVNLYLNGGQNPLSVIPTTVSKANEAPSLLKPYAFVGSFALQLPGIELNIGDNTFRVEAFEKVYGRLGYNEQKINIKANEPGSTNGGVEVDLAIVLNFNGADSLSDLTANHAIDAAITDRVSTNTQNVVLHATVDADGHYILASDDHGVAIYIDDSAVLEQALSPTTQGLIQGAIQVSSFVPAYVPLTLYETNAGSGIFDSRVDVSVSFNGALNPSANDQIQATVNRPNANEQSAVLTETGPNTLLFVNTDGSFTISFNSTELSGSYRDILDANVSNQALFISNYAVKIYETEIDSLQFESDYSYFATSDEYVSYSGWVFEISEAQLVTKSDIGDFHPYMLQVQGPTPFLNQIQHVQTADGPRLVEQGPDGNYYVKMKNSPVAIFLLVYYGTDYRDDIDNSGQFLFGFAKGLGAGGIGMVEGVWQIGKVAFKESTRISPMGFVFVMKYGDSYETEKRFFRTTAKVAETIGKIVWEIRNDRDQFITAALNGNWNEADAISAKYRIALALGGELFVELYEVYMSLPSDQQGYYLGAAMFEIGTLAASYAKAPAKLAQIGAKTDFLNDLAKTRFFQNGPAKVALERTVAYAAGRLTTAMCFAAGTKVHTDNGLVDIEKIEKGDRVLSQDPATHRQEYKTVINTIVTRPTQLYHLSYRPRQPHRVGNDKKHLDSNEDSDEYAPSELTCTGEHPFYIVGRNDFIQASQIRAGDEVLLADGTAAVVAEIESERVEEIGSFATYNIEVEGFHTYFVGWEGVWVHNNSTNPCGVVYDIYNYYRKFRKEGTLGPIEAFEKMEKALPWNDMELMAKALKEIWPEIIIDIPVEKVWTSGRTNVAGTAAKNIWWHYTEHVLLNKSFNGLEKEFPNITNAFQYISEARRFMDTVPAPNLREWSVEQYIEKYDRICVKICRLDLDSGHFGVKWVDHPDDAGKLATFFRANRENLTWRQWAEKYGYPKDKPF